jgi:hypothetical protein
MQVTIKTHETETRFTLNIKDKVYTLYTGYTPDEYYNLKDTKGNEFFFSTEWDVDCDGCQWITKFKKDDDFLDSSIQWNFKHFYTDKEINDLQKHIDKDINRRHKEYMEYMETYTDKERERNRLTWLTNQDDKIRGY